MPKNQTWFKEENGKSLSFLCQINFSDVSPFDNSDQLPKSGIIYFFYSAEQDAWGFDPSDKDNFKVYYNEDLSDLQRLDFPSDIENFSRYKSCKLDFTSSASVPNREISSVRGILSDKESDLYIDLSEDGEITKLLGHSDNIQGPMEEECQLVTNNINAGGP